MLEFLKGLFLVLHFSAVYILMTVQLMLPLILLSMLMILLSILSVIRYLICGNNFNLWQQLCGSISINLQYAHVWNTVVTSGLMPLVATWNMQDC